MPRVASLLDQVQAATSAAEVTRAFLSPAGLAAGSPEMQKAVECAPAFEEGMLWGFLRDAALVGVLDRSVGLAPGQRDALRAGMAAVLALPATSRQRDHALFVLQTLHPSAAAQLAVAPDVPALWAECLPKRTTTALTGRHRRNIAGLLTLPAGVTAAHLQTIVTRGLDGLSDSAEPLMSHRACDESVVAAILEQLRTHPPALHGTVQHDAPTLRAWNVWYMGLWSHPAFTTAPAQRAAWWRLAATSDIPLDAWRRVLISGAQPDARVAAHALRAWPNGLETTLLHTPRGERAACARALDRSLVEVCLQSTDAGVRQIGVLAVDTAGEDTPCWPPVPELADARLWPAIVGALQARARHVALWCDGQVKARGTQFGVRSAVAPLSIAREQEMRRDVAVLARLDPTQPMGAGALDAMQHAFGSDLRAGVNEALKHLRNILQSQQAATALAHVLTADTPQVTPAQPVPQSMDRQSVDGVGGPRRR